jgi:RNAse (barnase) inhibitor barstar
MHNQYGEEFDDEQEARYQEILDMKLKDVWKSFLQRFTYEQEEYDAVVEVMERETREEVEREFRVYEILESMSSAAQY